MNNVIIHPNNLITSIDVQNTELQTAIDNLRLLQAEIDTYNGEEGLQGAAFTAHKAYMSDGHGEVIRHMIIAYETLIAANNSHRLSVLWNLTERNRTYNQTMIIASINTYSQLQTAWNNTLFSGGSNWNSATIIHNWQRINGPISQNTLTNFANNLAANERRRDEINRYISVTRNTYNEAELAFAELERAKQRITYASQCTTTGVTVPLAWEGLDALVAQTRFEREFNATMKVLQDGNGWNWDGMESLLRRPYNEISSAEYLALAYIFTNLVYSENDEHLTKFISFMTTQVGTVRFNLLQSINNSPREFTEWEVDTNKLTRIMQGIDTLASITDAQQLALYRLQESDFNGVIPEGDTFADVRGDAIDALSSQQRINFQSRTALALIYQLQMQGGSSNPFRGNASAPNLSLAVSENGGIVITYANNNTRSHTMAMPTANGELFAPGMTHHINPQSITINTVEFGSEVTAQVVANGLSFFGINPNINRENVLLNDAAVLVGETILTEAINTGLSASLSKIPFVGLALLPLRAYSNYQEAVELRDNLMHFGSSVNRSTLSGNLRLYATTFTMPGATEQNIVFFPTFETEERFRILNRAIERGGYGEPVSLDCVFERPHHVEEMLRVTGLTRRVGGTW